MRRFSLGRKKSYGNFAIQKSAFCSFDERRLSARTAASHNPDVFVFNLYEFWFTPPPLATAELDKKYQNQNKKQRSIKLAKLFLSPSQDI